MADDCQTVGLQEIEPSNRRSRTLTTVTLGDGDQVYTATAAGDDISGGNGNDTITASSGGNTLHGNDGDDILNGAEGSDTLYGDDTINAANHNVISGNGGDDTIYSYSANDAIDAGADNDTVVIYATRVTASDQSSQLVDGGDGNDTLELDALQGSGAPVTIVVSANFQPIIGGSIKGSTFANFETLIFHGGSGMLNITGGAGNDSLEANHGHATIFDAGALNGLGGDDTLSFNGDPIGIEAIDGGEGNDTFVWNPANSDWSGVSLTLDMTLDQSMQKDGETFATLAGIENLFIDASGYDLNEVDITGAQGTNTLLLRGASINVTTFDQADRITIMSGAAAITAGGGDDLVVIAGADTRSSTVHGNDGNDTLTGGSGQDSIYGDYGDDILTAGNGRSHLYGGAGNDALSLSSVNANNGTGHAIIDGGDGHDTLTLDFSNATTAFKGNFSAATANLSDGTVVMNVESVIFSAGAGNDTLTASNDEGGNAFNKLYGNGGNDRLAAGAHGAYLDGGAGNDILVGGAGVDYLVGGSVVSERNTVSYANSTVGVRVDLRLTTAQQGKGDAAGDILSDVQNIIGSKHRDVLIGSDPDSGRQATGDNVLDGGKGRDTLIGNGGQDTFVFSTGYGHDTIRGFATLGDDHDVVDLSHYKSIDNYDDLLGDMHKSGRDVVIDGDNGDTLTLLHMKLGKLSEADFHF
jgi:Ca2+-binding RTX toxin-like protein